MNKRISFPLAISVIIILSLVLIGGIFGYWYFMPEEDYEPSKTKSGIYNLIAAYPKNLDIYIRNLETDEEVSLGLVNKVLMLEGTLACELKEDLKKCLEEESMRFYTEFFESKNISSVKFIEKNTSDSFVKRLFSLEKEKKDVQVFLLGGIQDKPIFSKDGKKMIFARFSEDQFQSFLENYKKADKGIRSDIFVLNLLTKKEVLIQKNLNMVHHNAKNTVFSPDNKKIAFSLHSREQVQDESCMAPPKVVVFDLTLPEGSEQRKKVVFVGQKGVGEIDKIKWFDNERIIIHYNKDAFLCGGVHYSKPDRNIYELIILNTETGEQKEIVSFNYEELKLLGGLDRWPRWFDLSSDNSKIVYLIGKDIYHYDPEDESTKKIASLGVSGKPKSLKWSPNGDYLAVLVRDTGDAKMVTEMKIVILDREGKILRSIGKDEFQENKERYEFYIDSFVWAPEKEEIAVTIHVYPRGGRGGDEVWLTDISGNTKEKIAPNLPLESLTAWIPLEIVNRMMKIYKVEKQEIEEKKEKSETEKSEEILAEITKQKESEKLEEEKIEEKEKEPEVIELTEEMLAICGYDSACYLFLALFTNNLKACARIKSPGRNNFCQALLKKDCSILSADEDKNFCQAILQKDPSILGIRPEEDPCYLEEISPEELESCMKDPTCYYEPRPRRPEKCYYLESILAYNAFLRRDSELCNEIPDEMGRQYCYGYYIRIMLTAGTRSSFNIDVCAKIEMVGACYATGALYREDDNVCNIPREKKIRNDCYELLAISTATPSLCEKVERNKQECYMALMAIAGDPEICNRVGSAEGTYVTSYLNSECYKNYSSLEKPSDICLKIENTEFKNKCIQMYSGF